MALQRITRQVGGDLLDMDEVCKNLIVYSRQTWVFVQVQVSVQTSHLEKFSVSAAHPTRIRHKATREGNMHSRLKHILHSRWHVGKDARLDSVQEV